MDGGVLGEGEEARSEVWSRLLLPNEWRGKRLLHSHEFFVVAPVSGFKV